MKKKIKNKKNRKKLVKVFVDFQYNICIFTGCLLLTKVIPKRIKMHRFAKIFNKKILIFILSESVSCIIMLQKKPRKNTKIVLKNYRN